MVFVIVFIASMSVVLHEKHVRERTGEDKAKRQQVSGIFTGDHPKNYSDNRKPAKNWYKPFSKFRLHYCFTFHVNMRAGTFEMSLKVSVTFLVDLDRLFANESVPFR